MLPNIHIGACTISAYIVMTLIGIFVAGPVSMKQLPESDRDDYLTVLLWSSVGVLIGSHFLYGITNIQSICQAIRNKDSFLNIVYFFGGSVFYGGLLGGILAAAIYCRLSSKDYRKYIDAAAVFLPLFHTFGRIGCFLSGCCYGIVCDSGFVYHYSPIPAANGVPRFPVQLLEACGNLAIWGLLLRLKRHRHCQNRLLLLYLLLYSLMRFFLEFLRGDAYRGFLLALSTSQWISILLFAACMWILAKNVRRKVSAFPRSES